MVEQLICNQQVKGSSPFVSSLPKNEEFEEPTNPARGDTRGLLSGEVSRGEGAVGCPSGQREQTVNLPRLALRRFESFPHHFVARAARAHAGVAQLVEHQPSKLRVAGSSPVARSGQNARVAQSVERVLGKDEVTGSIPVASSGRIGAWYVVSGAWDFSR